MQGFLHLGEGGLGRRGDVASADLDGDLGGVAVQVGDQHRLDDLVVKIANACQPALGVALKKRTMKGRLMTRQTVL